MKKHIVIIGYVWVEPNSSAAGSRMLQLIEIFLKNKYSVTFACPAQKTERSIDLNELGVKEEGITLNSSSFDNFIKEESPSIVMFDRFMMEEQFGWRVTENCAKSLKILDTEDLHCLRKVRHQAFKKQREFELSELLSSDLAKREIASILRCDVSLIISEYEIKLLKEVFKIDEKLYIHLPFLLNKLEPNHVDHWLSYNNRVDFVFIGNYLHAPNVNAVVELKKRIWPLIRKELQNVQLHIYGAYPPDHILQMNNAKEGFIVKGAVDNALAVIEKAKVMLAPLMFGAGIKGKLTDAMLVGTPSVTTEIGAEGMRGHLPWNGFIENDSADFAIKSVKLYTDNQLWKEKQGNAIEIINSIYDKEKLEIRFSEEIENRLLHLDAYRNNNFIGSLLNFETIRATKYMSKWIEEKNK
ncbi:Glycosyltransferase involved in cell wall bisynthesis [Tenacibaculum sp. MAR_2009_124]|uniref:glycosyltransferase n=1 Tax=Tenacibaculum sp. MAR_2009_124 TaxID=1250059 RepID=UPI0008991CBE|nr:glycosyltransferase family 4 protein [Tenacibaculum sp. MAR_2009_124]SEC80798.1 Glycosyltransferase involved in cell wall bisynthesis [Tenacibaculum sp. MAR_2009_124]